MAGFRLLWSVLAAAASTKAEVVHYDWDVREWQVDFLRPTINTSTLCLGRESNHSTASETNQSNPLRPCGGMLSPTNRNYPFLVPRERLKTALLVNGQYPGPLIEVNEDDIIEVAVTNSIQDTSVVFHWHGVWNTETPWDDGPFQIAMGPIPPMSNYTYRFRAYPPGTHYWHSHMDAQQQARGLKGPIIIHPKKKQQLDLRPPQASKQADAVDYKDKVIFISDEWQNPQACFKLDGAMPGNPACNDATYTSFNGQYGDGTDDLPYPLITVEQGQCYRLRFIAAGGNAENWIVTMDGHNMTVTHIDGGEIEPIQVRSFNGIHGNRIDVLMCADQPDGYYKITFNYNYGCGMLAGHHFPVPGFDDVEACKWYAFLRYDGTKAPLPKAYKPFFPLFEVPKGTGGGAKPSPVTGEVFDLSLRSGFKKVTPLSSPDYEEWPEEPDMRIMMTVGLRGPSSVTPMSMPSSRGRWYMDLDHRRAPWSPPATPLLHTRGGQCGADRKDHPVIDIPENATHVEIVINNLSPTQHVLHLHGQTFRVVNVADFQWCNVNKTACFVMPKEVNPCDKEDRAFGDDKDPEIDVPDYAGHSLHTRWLPTPLYWGCKYNETKDRSSQTPVNRAIAVDSFSLWQRSWAVLRVKFDKPGAWLFHCHLLPHIPLGMMSAFNVLPSKQLPIPWKSPTYGPCPVWKRPGDQATGAVHV